MIYFTEHGHRTRCTEFLPKPKRKHLGLITQCSYCGRLYVGNRHDITSGYVWTETAIRREGKENK